MPAKIQIEHVTGAAPGVSKIITQCRFRSDELDDENLLSPIIVPPNFGTSFYNGSGISASGTPQHITVNDSTVFSAGDYVLIDSYTAVQEVVQVSSTDGAGFTAVFLNNHQSEVTILKVKAAFSKWIQFRFTAAPALAVTGLRLIRTSALPVGVYDQIQIVPAASYAQQSNNPLAGSVPFFTGSPVYVSTVSQTAVGLYPYAVVLQLLFSDAVAGPVGDTAYRVQWSEA